MLRAYWLRPVSRVPIPVSTRPTTRNGATNACASFIVASLLRAATRLPLVPGSSRTERGESAPPGASENKAPAET
jgi:hypothetical protein